MARQRASETLINRWAQSDPYAAGAWLRTLPPGDSRDGTVISFTRHISGSDPQAAIQWAETIGNDGLSQPPNRIDRSHLGKNRFQQCDGVGRPILPS